MSRRNLSAREAAILKLIQVHHGSHNTEDEVMFTERDEAVIWARGERGSIPVVANLTILATWRADGTIPTEEALIREWLRVQDT